ncbi:MAG TPA: hypothetical protein VKY32_05635 [Flavobacterium sp.]|nr:hypothetical protein [Flavobacterium sp.]
MKRQFLSSTILLMITSFTFCSCNSDDDVTTDQKQTDSYIKLTFEGGDNDSPPTEIRIDDKYYYYPDSFRGAKQDTIGPQVEMEEYAYFSDNYDNSVKYRFRINAIYKKSEDKIVDYDIEFGEFYIPRGSSGPAATGYQNYKNSMKIDNIIVQDGYVMGDFEGILYDNILGLIVEDPSVKETKITNGSFKFKLEE